MANANNPQIDPGGSLNSTDSGDGRTRIRRSAHRPTALRAAYGWMGRAHPSASGVDMEQLPEPTPAHPVRVVVAGGGVAALEATLALADLAGDRVTITLIAPDEEFASRPAAVLEPFGEGEQERFAVAEIAGEAGAEVHAARLAWVDRSARCAHTADHAAVGYDYLLLGLGARADVVHEHATTIAGIPGERSVHGLVTDIDAGRVRRLALIVPGPGSWQMPLYELALLATARARASGVALEVSMFTPESVPMQAFGDRAGAAAAELLRDRGILLTCRVDCQVPDPHTVRTDPVAGASTLWATATAPARPAVDSGFDRVMTLPRLLGPHLRGVPCVSEGFIPVDVHGRIRGTRREFAAGDGTDCAVRHGGMAAQQADAAARSIAALAGAPVQPSPARPVIHGLLATGEEPRYLSARIVGGHGLESELSRVPSWSPAEKLEATYLAAALADLRARARR